MDRLRNCWERWSCGREPGGHNVNDQGVCPASTETRLDGIHGGTNGGRSCWAISETLCPNHTGFRSTGRVGCLDCPFYNEVIKYAMKHESLQRFVFTVEMFKRLQHDADEDVAARSSMGADSEG